jgi:hypothetical protein
MGDVVNIRDAVEAMNVALVKAIETALNSETYAAYMTTRVAELLQENGVIPRNGTTSAAKPNPSGVLTATRKDGSGRSSVDAERVHPEEEAMEEGEDEPQEDDVAAAEQERGLSSDEVEERSVQSRDLSSARMMITVGPKIAANRYLVSRMKNIKYTNTWTPQITTWTPNVAGRTFYLGRRKMRQVGKNVAVTYDVLGLTNGEYPSQLTVYFGPPGSFVDSY